MINALIIFSGQRDSLSYSPRIRCSLSEESKIISIAICLTGFTLSWSPLKHQEFWDHSLCVFWRNRSYGSHWETWTQGIRMVFPTNYFSSSQGQRYFYLVCCPLPWWVVISSFQSANLSLFSLALVWLSYILVSFHSYIFLPVCWSSIVMKFVMCACFSCF